MDRGNINERSEHLTEELESLRRSCAQIPEGEQRSRIRQTLEDSLEGQTDENAQRILQGVRNRLIQSARDSEQRVQELDEQVRELRAQLASVTAERDSLAQGATEPATETGGGDLLDRFRKGLVMTTKKQEVQIEELGLPDSEIRMFRMVHALLAFTISYTEAADSLRRQFEIGITGKMSTVMWQEWIRQLRQCFRACLNDEEGSLAALNELLERNKIFLISLNESYASCVYDGSRKLLDVLDPEAMREQHKRALGFNYEKTWETIAQVHNDISNLTGKELWGQYFFESFQESLSRSVE